MTRWFPLALGLFLPAAATAAPVTCPQVVAHWGQVYKASQGHSVDTAQLARSCETFGQIGGNQVAARCVLGMRSLADDCGWGPAVDRMGVDYRNWRLPAAAANVAVAVPGATTAVTTGPAGVGMSVRIDDPTTGEQFSAEVGAGMGVNVTVSGTAPVGAAPQVVIVESPGAPPPPQRAQRPMAPGPFAALVAQVSDEAFSDDKLQLIQTAAQRNWFTCEQIAQLMGLITMDDDKVQVVRVARSRILDPKNAHMLNGPLTFSSSKEEVQKLFLR